MYVIDIEEAEENTRDFSEVGPFLWPGNAYIVEISTINCSNSQLTL